MAGRNSQRGQAASGIIERIDRAAPDQNQRRRARCSGAGLAAARPGSRGEPACEAVRAGREGGARGQASRCREAIARGDDGNKPYRARVDATASQPEQDMIVTATPDLVLDVLEAADPVSQRTATGKLEALKSSGADFAATMDAEVGRAKAATADQSMAKVAETQSTAINGPPVQVIKAPASGEVYRKFEAFILQTFVETMLPKESEQVFGKGTAGGGWEAMLGEEIGGEVGKGKGDGICQPLCCPPPGGAGRSGKGGGWFG